MLLMALDHVRDFFHIYAFTDSPTNLATTNPTLFFTRWITHFCAPIFLFLSGTSAFIAWEKKSRKELSLFLIKRGLWMVIAEITIINFCWSFDPFFSSIYLQVIWAIGWSMIILGILVRLPMIVIVSTGCIIFFGHNILDYVHLPRQGTGSILWNILFTSKFTMYHITTNRTVNVLYAVLPWTSIMLLGYSIGYFYRRGFDAALRRKLLLSIGLGLMVLFVVLRFINHYGDPAPWVPQKDNMFTLLSFLNVTKYPTSLQYGCLTLAPALIFLALTDSTRNQLTDIVTVYGKVPFFYYILHILLIHFLCIAFFFASGHGWSSMADIKGPFYFRPVQFGFNLWVVYVIWLWVVALLYNPCKWFNNYKSIHQHWWLSYI